MTKRLFSLSLVALATTQAHAATSYRLEVIDQPVGAYQTTGTTIATDGTIGGGITTRLSAKTVDEEVVYHDELGRYDDETVGALYNDIVDETTGRYRSLSTNVAYIGEPTLTLLPGLGAEDEDLTVDTAVNGESEGLYFGYSSGPWSTVTFTNSSDEEETHYVRDFTTRGYVTDLTQSHALMPIYTIPTTSRGDQEVLNADEHFGGVSLANGGAGQWVVGQSSIGLGTGGESIYENCQDEDSIIPIRTCLRSLSYQSEATAWTLVDGVPSTPKAIGLLAEPEDDDDPANFASSAQAVNIHGLAVGQSVVRDGRYLRNVATLFDVNEGKALKALTVTNDTISSSIANDINDDGIAVGRAVFPSTYSTSKFFVYNTNDDTITYPASFYDSANSIAYAVNNSGLVVGAADWERVPPSSSRRQHAFVYDLNNDSFKDLNDLLQFDGSLLTQRYDGDTCAAREDWTLEYARDINDNGEIVATAVTTLRDTSGNLVLDDDGATQYVLRAVKLVPTDEEPASCVTDQDEPYQRKGSGSMGLLSLGLLGLLGWRRRR
ncbi:DUF3466 family protein [Gallaecimonas xiamenensis]|uniref:DUF3466 family protein n=1 Tax=Gallaecimonas xiamenensis 3-C-1 TaxID=745411 RepID=K2IPZ1_9GAMM|nr:DUF3466 family protein [Gallaecimonas xiamenensis]EKE72171.1 hypothetical protein B3C1_11384 [Gallaecimonas xiamenensis 3-C-1]